MSGGGGADLDEGEVGGDEEEEGGGGGGGGHLKGRKEGGGGDELDLALSALRDCDTDFSKFLPVRRKRRVRSKNYKLSLKVKGTV
jgi:hypothetical protein